MAAGGLITKCMNTLSHHSMHLSSCHTSISSKYMSLALPATSTPQVQRGLHTNNNGSLKSPEILTSLLQERRKGDSKSNKSIEEFQEKTRTSLTRRALDPVSAMKLIDTLQWLGISYHYEEEIELWLEKLSNWDAGESVQATALRFRLLRQNAMPVSCDVFEKFMDGGKFRKPSRQHMEGLLNLYDASYLGTNGEDHMMLEAMKFSENQLKISIEAGALPRHVSRRVSRALELPRHLRMERLESRLYIDEYSMQNKHSSFLLEHAKLDFNQVQLLHQVELAEISRWWKQLGLVDKLSFARDRPMECFLWTVGILPEPKYSGARIELAKTIAILLVIDDIFDTYGSLDELSLFTRAIQRWDLNAIEQLPEYMKICYMALYNTTNEIAYKVLKEQGRTTLPSLAKAWIDTIEAFMVEAEWVKKGHRPSLEDYTENAVTTAGSYMALVHAFFLMGQGLTPQNMKLMSKTYPKIFSNSGKILRLWDDLGTSKEEQDRGDDSSSIPLFMREKNLANESEAREYITRVILNLWKDLNMELVGTNSLPLPLIKACFNMSRTSQVIYQHQEDSYFSSVDKFVNFILLEPIEL